MRLTSSVQVVVVTFLWLSSLGLSFIRDCNTRISPPTLLLARVARTPAPNSAPRKKESNEISLDAEVADSIRLADDERLQKVISRAGIASRRGAEKMILDGRVYVNGKIVTELGIKVKPRKDIIIVDGKKIQLPDASKVFWVALYKPKDVLTTLDDEKGRNTISTLVPKAKELRLLPVGGLDRQASGLLILTNENGWIHPLTHPSFQHRRRYEVVLKGLLTEDHITELKNGAVVSDEAGNSVRLKPCQIEVIDQDVRGNLVLLDVSLDESVPRQIEKMVEKVSCEFISLKRTEFGSLKLKGLRKGQWKELSPTEITKLKKSCSMKSDDKFKYLQAVSEKDLDNLLVDNMDRSIAPLLNRSTKISRSTSQIPLRVTEKLTKADAIGGIKIPSGASTDAQKLRRMTNSRAPSSATKTTFTSNSKKIPINRDKYNGNRM